MDTNNFIINVKAEDLYEDIANDVEKRFNTSNYNINRALPTGKNKKVIELMKHEIGGKVMTEFVALKPKTYFCLTDKKPKGTMKCVIKRVLKFNDYKNCLLDNEIILKSQQRFKSEAHNVYTEEINRIALSSIDDKRLKTFDRITKYLYGISVGKVCKTELLNKYK